MVSIPGDTSIIGIGAVTFVPGIGYVSKATGQPVGGAAVGGQGVTTLGGQPAYGTYPTSAPAGALTATGAFGGGSPVATGVDLFMAMLEATFQAERLRQSAVDQSVNIAQLSAELGRVSPSRAAAFATALGIPGLEPDLSAANAFAGEGSTGVFGGRIGTQDIRLPMSLSGKELSFLGSNPNVASVLADISGYLGRPDLIQSSMASAIPSVRGLSTF